MASYTFKSVGKTTQQIKTETQVLSGSLVPIGPKVPLSLSKNGDGLFAMNYQLADSIADNLRNLLLTNWGDRFTYDFGANLRPLLTEFVSIDNFADEASLRIKRAVERWMPYLNIKEITAKTEHEYQSNLAIIRLTVNYDVPILDIFNKGLQVILWVM